MAAAPPPGAAAAAAAAAAQDACLVAEGRGYALESRARVAAGVAAAAALPAALARLAAEYSHPRLDAAPVYVVAVRDWGAACAAPAAALVECARGREPRCQAHAYEAARRAATPTSRCLVWPLAALAAAAGDRAAVCALLAQTRPPEAPPAPGSADGRVDARWWEALAALALPLTLDTGWHTRVARDLVGALAAGGPGGGGGGVRAYGEFARSLVNARGARDPPWYWARAAGEAAGRADEAAPPAAADAADEADEAGGALTAADTLWLAVDDAAAHGACVRRLRELCAPGAPDAPLVLREGVFGDAPPTAFLTLGSRCVDAARLRVNVTLASIAGMLTAARAHGAGGAAELDLLATRDGRAVEWLHAPGAPPGRAAADALADYRLRGRVAVLPRLVVALRDRGSPSAQRAARAALQDIAERYPFQEGDLAVADAALHVTDAEWRAWLDPLEPPRFLPGRGGLAGDWGGAL